MEKISFEHRVSRGSRFNQIYIPLQMNRVFEAGDLVEVKLISKRVELYYSKNLKKISSFKERLVKEIFSIVKLLSGVEQIFFVGSFLTKNEDYKDIDIIIISDVKDIDEKVYSFLTEKFSLKFHILSIPLKRFEELIIICPLTRNMLNYYISDKKLELVKEKRIDKDHLNFLLMMPEDLLKINVTSRAFYDSLRRLITIENFLESKESKTFKIEEELKTLFGDFLFSRMRNNEPLEAIEIKKIRKFMKLKINKIKIIIKRS